MKVNTTSGQSEKSNRTVYAAHVFNPPVKPTPELHLVTDKGPVVVYLGSRVEREKLAAALASAEPCTAMDLEPPRPVGSAEPEPEPAAKAAPDGDEAGAAPDATGPGDPEGGDEGGAELEDDPLA